MHCPRNESRLAFETTEGFHWMINRPLSNCSATVFRPKLSHKENQSNNQHNTFTFMHLADAFIQSDLHCIQVTVLHFIGSNTIQTSLK